MDPANNNPAQPINPDVQNAALNPPVNPVVAPTAPASPAAAPAPTVSAPVSPAPANPTAPVTPGVTPEIPSANANGTMSMNQMFQPQPATQANVFDEMTAISVPEGPKPPDPVEEELKAPLKAAEPVPGSIGSAVSMPPADGSQPQMNGVNEQMMANGVNPMAANANAPAGKKPSFLDNLVTKTKMSKSTLILLAVVAGLVVVALIVILVLVATGAL